jgi:hypothetical protein
MTFKEITPSYTENHTKPENAELMTLEAAGTKNYHSV